MGKRSGRGTVAISPYKGRLRLRWSYEGERFTLGLGVPDSEVNRIAARIKATTIEGDIATGNFDRTLAKYRPTKQVAVASISITELIERFTSHKAKTVLKRTLSKFKALHTPMDEFFGSGKPASSITEDAADDFRIWLSKNLMPATVKERVVSLNACWNWGVKQGLVSFNPWAEQPARVKVPPTQKPKPFTQQEITTIVTAFRQSKYYRHYADFVEFRFGCGCRIEEAIGLRWKHLTEDCSAIWIGEAISRGKVRKPTKNNRARQFKLTSRMQQMLLARRPANYQPDDLVFPAPRGGILDDHTFSQRAWKKMLQQIGLEHRVFNSVRHTFISHALRKLEPMKVAELAGHNQQTLFKHYAAEIGSAVLPELL